MYVYNYSFTSGLKLCAYSGPRCGDGKQSYLFVMPFVNQSKSIHFSVAYVCVWRYTESLDKQFVIEKSCKCVLDYMKHYDDQQKFIYQNYLLLFHQVFDALSYLQTQQVVHRDVKRTKVVFLDLLLLCYWYLFT